MALFDTLSNTTDDNAVDTLYALLKGLRANVTRATVWESLEQHPDFPSLLSLSDVLTGWQVANTGLQLNTVEQLRELPLPFVAHLRKNNGWYVLVTEVEGEQITYIDSEKGESTRGESTPGRQTESLTDFEKNWSGIVLLAEADQQAGEADYANNRKKEILHKLRIPFVVTGILLISLIGILSIAQELTTPDWLLLVTKVTGLTLSGLLVAKQLGSKNALTDRLCRINSKTNCDDVLNSPAAKLWGWLSWADVGLLYFAGGLLTVLLIGIDPHVRPLLHGLALLALPYTLFSVYYQGVVLKQWCPLCLGVQGVLLMEGIVATTSLHALPVSIPPYWLTLSAFLIPALTWVVIKPLLLYLPKNRREHDELMRLKRNPDLFRSMLLQQPQMSPIHADLHPIVIGNPDAEHTITLVTNPYCGPCAKAHKKLEQLLDRNDNLRAEIIFTCDGTDGLTTQMAIHTMALAEQGMAARALAGWYEQSEKNIDQWVKQYPVRPGQTDWVAVANRHQDWCMAANIAVTPTLFIDRYQLPELYRLEKLRWLINSLEPLPINPQLSV